MNQVIARWDATLNDVFVRFDALLAEACGASRELVEHLGADLTPLTLPWTAVEAHKHAHAEEISAAWNHISDELAAQSGLPDGVMAREGSKRDYATCELDIRYQRAYRMVMAAAADKLYQRALAADAGGFRCRHCGALLDRIVVVSQALNVECGYCGALCTVDPGSALRGFAAMGARLLGEREALPPWEAMVRAETEMRQYRNRGDVPLGLLQHYQAAARAYWTTLLGVESACVPEQQPYVASKVDRYMKDVDKTLFGYPQWRARPR